MPISDIPQADEPVCAAVAKLVANLWFGVIFKNDHGCLAMGQCRGPRQKLVVVFGIRKAILKSNSPACGSDYIYDGTFTATRKRGDGVLAALLKLNNIKVCSEYEYSLKIVNERW